MNIKSHHQPQPSSTSALPFPTTSSLPPTSTHFTTNTLPPSSNPSHPSNGPSQPLLPPKHLDPQARPPLPILLRHPHPRYAPYVISSQFPFSQIPPILTPHRSRRPYAPLSTRHQASLPNHSASVVRDDVQRPLLHGAAGVVRRVCVAGGGVSFAAECVGREGAG